VISKKKDYTRNSKNCYWNNRYSWSQRYPQWYCFSIF